MYDSIDISQMPPGPGNCYAGYVNGTWPTYNALLTTFPGHNILSIAVNASANADCLDVETGDATPGQAPGWYARQVARGIIRPCLYANAGTMNQVIAAMRQVPRSSMRLWSAHYGAGQHICGPATCKLIPVAMDGTQWTDVALGRNLDESTLLPNFFGAAPPPPPPPPGPVYITSSEMGHIMGQLPVLKNGMNDTSLPHWYVRRVQCILNSVYGNKLTVDGAYGPATVTAVKAVQAEYKLAVDGVTGPGTWSALVTGALLSPVDKSLRTVVGCCCSYEVLALITGKVPTISSFCRHHRIIEMVMLGALVVHLHFERIGL